MTTQTSPYSRLTQPWRTGMWWTSLWTSNDKDELETFLKKLTGWQAGSILTAPARLGPRVPGEPWYNSQPFFAGPSHLLPAGPKLWRPSLQTRWPGWPPQGQGCCPAERVVSPPAPNPGSVCSLRGFWPCAKDAGTEPWGQPAITV